MRTACAHSSDTTHLLYEPPSFSSPGLPVINRLPLRPPIYLLPQCRRTPKRTGTQRKCTRSCPPVCVKNMHYSRCAHWSPSSLNRATKHGPQSRALGRAWLLSHVSFQSGRIRMLSHSSRCLIATQKAPFSIQMCGSWVTL